MLGFFKRRPKDGVEEKDTQAIADEQAGENSAASAPDELIEPITEMEVHDAELASELAAEAIYKEETLPEEDEPPTPEEFEAPVAEESASASKGWFARLKAGLTRTRSQLAGGLGRLILGKKVIDADLVDAIETQLLLADVGMDATTEIIDALSKGIARKSLKDPQALLEALKRQLQNLLEPCHAPLAISGNKDPYVILVVGINGAGKTTTIGKLAKGLQQKGQRVMLAAGDTFRAAAVEQLKIWGERNEIPVIAQQQGADSASVIYDAVESATARDVNVLIADTAGRLHTQNNLMKELEKVKRVMQKQNAQAPHEVLLVLDAGIGQNALEQVRQFHESVGVSGLVLTKLDGTAKGGVIFAIAKAYNIPIRFIGVGEGIDDLKPFEPTAFIDALFDTEE